ncbi:MAG: cupin domain-containing protein [Verrucomicrobiota bacterium]|nr:cupin domain-containing protein [Verrucomicrobiota bacterium]
MFSTSKTKRYRFPTHENDLVVDRADSETSEVFVVVLEPGEAPPLHQHDDTEQVFYVMEGNGVLRIGGKRKPFPVRPGDVVRIPPKTPHTIRCKGKRALRYLAVDCFVGGRPAAEPTWDSHVKVLCRQQGWDWRRVKR